MINKEELDNAIEQFLNTDNPTAQTCIALAAFMTVRDHLTDTLDMVYDSGSDFGNAIKGKPPEKILPVIDELMDTIKILNSQLYDGVIDKIREA